MPTFSQLRFKFLLSGQKLIERGAWIFAPVSWIWGFVSFCKNKLYDLSLLPVQRVGGVVVSIGNIVAGGTGKTPLVHLLASRFPHRRVAILSRGYGSIPDEPMLLARRLPNVEIYVGKNRVKNGKRAVREGAELLILDDGFQHRKMARDFDWVLLDGSDPLGKGHYLPWGYLRDSPKRLEKADALFVMGGKWPGAIEVKSEVCRILDRDEREISSIQGWRVGLFCGIGKPERFKKTVAELGAEVVGELILADHEPVDWVRLERFFKSLDVNALVCTEKDFIKIPKEGFVDLPIIFLEIEMKIVSEAAKWEKLIEKIDQKIENSIRNGKSSKNSST